MTKSGERLLAGAREALAISEKSTSLTDEDFWVMNGIVRSGPYVLTPTMFAAVRKEYEARGLPMPVDKLIESKPLPRETKGLWGNG